MKRIALALLAATVLLSACSTDAPSDDPEGALLSAMEKTGALEGLRMHLTLLSTPESLQALADSGGGLRAEDAETILDSTVTLTNKGQGPDASSEFTLSIGGENAVEFKTIDRVLYARADVRYLMEVFGARSAQLDAMASQAEAQGLGFVRPAIEGEWLSIEGLDQAFQQMTGQSIDAALPKQQQFLEELTRSFREHATITSEGMEDAGEHMVVTLPLRPILEGVMDELGQLGQLPVGTLPDASEIPDEEITFDVWVDDERVRRLELDFLQFADFAEGEDVPEGVEQLALRVDLEEFGDEIEAPKDAVAIDPQQIFGLLGGMFMGGMGAGMDPPAPGGDIGAGFDCNDLKGAPPSVLKQFAEECPELQP